MAITHGANLHGSWTTTGATSYNFTTSAEVTSGRVCVVLAEGARGGSVTPARPTVSGLGLTWTFVVENIDTAGTNRYYVGAFVGTGTPSGTTLTIDWSGVSMVGCGAVVADFDGVDTGTLTVQSVAGSGTSGTGATATLPSAPTSGAVWGGVVHEANEAVTPGSGWSEIGEGTGSTPLTGMQAQYQLANDQTCDWTWTTSASHHYVALELAAAAAGGHPHGRLPLVGVG